MSVKSKPSTRSQRAASKMADTMIAVRSLPEGRVLVHAARPAGPLYRPATRRTLPDMSEERVLVDRDGAVAHVRMNRPDKRNGLDLPMFEALVAAGQSLASDPSV